MSNEASRKAFEAWAKAAVLNTELWWTSSDTYKANTTNAAWEAWQASRKALEADVSLINEGNKAQQVAVPADKREPLSDAQLIDRIITRINESHGITPQGDKT